MIRIKPQLKPWESFSSQQVHKDPNTFYNKKKKKRKPENQRKSPFKGFKKQIKTLQDKIFLLDGKNSDLKYTLKCKEEELQRVREELNALKAEKTREGFSC